MLPNRKMDILLLAVEDGKKSQDSELVPWELNLFELNFRGHLMRNWSAPQQQ
jgi:hypothetical protein